MASIIDRLFNRAPKQEVKNELVTGTQHSKKVVEKAITKRQIYEVYNDLLKLNDAYDLANSHYNYNREQLHEVYRQIWRDTHLQSQWTTRKMKTLHREGYVVDKSGNESEQLTELLRDTTWFLDFISYSLDSMMWGFSPIQFGVWKNNEFNSFELKNTEGVKEVKDSVYVVNRDYIKPEFGIVVEAPSMISGNSYNDPKLYFLNIGKSHDLGLLEKLAPLILIKDNLTKNWSEWAEVFGMDIIIARTETSGSDRTALINALKNLASNKTGVFGPDDVIEFNGTSRSDAYKVYKEFMQYIDEQISKIVFGQDVVSNNTGQVVGKTGENIAKLYGNADARFVKSIINSQLLPFLTRIGAGNFEGYKWEWDTTEELTLQERAEIDLKISQMGKEHSDEYINETYGTDVIKKEEMQDSPSEIAEQIKNLYKV